MIASSSPSNRKWKTFTTNDGRSWVPCYFEIILIRWLATILSGPNVLPDPGYRLVHHIRSGGEALCTMLCSAVTPEREGDMCLPPSNHLHRWFLLHGLLCVVVAVLVPSKFIWAKLILPGLELLTAWAKRCQWKDEQTSNWWELGCKTWSRGTNE